jgi:hypothetical protein
MFARPYTTVVSYMFFELEPSVVFCSGMFISIAAFFVYYSERVVPYLPWRVQSVLGVGVVGGVGAAGGGASGAGGGKAGETAGAGGIDDL